MPFQADDPIAAASREAAKSAAARAHRLQRFGQSQLAIRIGREHAIASVLREAPRTGELQPGLFERRALRASVDLARTIAEIRDGLDRSVIALEDAATISAGAPALVFLLTGR
jgi:hypothetical protein